MIAAKDIMARTNYFSNEIMIWPALH